MASLINIAVCLILISTNVCARETLRLKPKDYMKYTKSVMAGARMGLQECDKKFKFEPWNCFVPKNSKTMPIFNRARLPQANKEAAFIHAITSAGAMYSVIFNCSHGQLENCRCQPKNRQKVRSKPNENVENWHWGGCSDNIAFGDLVARHFIDSLEGKRGDATDDRRMLNLHNNKLGRKIVKSTTKKVCKCHGSSSSCTMKTCMKKLDSFDKVADALLEKYHSAIQVTYNNGSFLDDGNDVITKKKHKLVYYIPSPDYCRPNKELNIPGVEGRVCEASDQSDFKKCEKLCKSCGLKLKLNIVTRVQKCNCRFVWCCFVKCDYCKKRLITATCVR